VHTVIRNMTKKKRKDICRPRRGVVKGKKEKLRGSVKEKNLRGEFKKEKLQSKNSHRNQKVKGL